MPQGCQQPLNTSMGIVVCECPILDMTRDCLHRETMDFLIFSTALHSCQNLLSEKEQLTILRHQEVLLSPNDKLSRLVANYPVLEV